jgi:hypothetical protein
MQTTEHKLRPGQTLPLRTHRGRRCKLRILRVEAGVVVFEVDGAEKERPKGLRPILVPFNEARRVTVKHA